MKQHVRVDSPGEGSLAPTCQAKGDIEHTESPGGRGTYLRPFVANRPGWGGPICSDSPNEVFTSAESTLRNSKRALFSYCNIHYDKFHAFLPRYFPPRSLGQVQNLSND